MSASPTKNYQEILLPFAAAASMFGNGLPARQPDVIRGFYDTLKPLLTAHGADAHVQAHVFDKLDEMTVSLETQTLIKLTALVAETAAETAAARGDVIPDSLESRVACMWKILLSREQDLTTNQKIVIARDTFEESKSPALKLAACDALESLGHRGVSIAVQPW